jgi:SOS response regulatory protein OraA/RecX
MELERPLLRRLRREMQRADARAAADRALARRDLSRRGLAARLERSGIASETAHATTRDLVAAGVVDDVRFASARASRLSERGWGDAAILARLEEDGIDAELASQAVLALPPEGERARTLVGEGGDARRTARLLARRGFSPETLEGVVGALDEEA